MLGDTKKVYYDSEEKIINEKGEIIEHKIESKAIDTAQEPPFVKMYLKDLMWLKNTPKWTNRVLSELLKNMSYGNEIILNVSLKKRIANELDMSINSINKALIDLKRTQILLQKERGIFIANPEYFAKGRWEQVKSLIIETRYLRGGGKKIKVKFEENTSKEIEGQTKLKI